MTQDIEQRLKQDATTIKTTAAQRLANVDFAKSIEHQLLAQSTKSSHSWLWGMAAAIGLSLMTWLLIENNPTPAIMEPLQLSNTLKEVKQLTHNIEEKVNQPLLKEQQAIIEDFKRLKSQMFSI
ncbi:MAG: hypothetical protein R3E90_06320 [Marinicella sp.]|nr:hypothetical protein [Xanthomonadales bacterium]